MSEKIALFVAWWYCAKCNIDVHAAYKRRNRGCQIRLRILGERNTVNSAVVHAILQFLMLVAGVIHCYRASNRPVRTSQYVIKTRFSLLWWLLSKGACLSAPIFHTKEAWATKISNCCQFITPCHEERGECRYHERQYPWFMLMQHSWSRIYRIIFYIEQSYKFPWKSHEWKHSDVLRVHRTLVHCHIRCIERCAAPLEVRFS